MQGIAQDEFAYYSVLMLYLFIKAALSGIIIAAVSEIAKKMPALGALVASLPLVSVLAMIWLYADTKNTALIADHAFATFWYVLPSLPMFIVLPLILRAGLSFPLALTLSCVMTVVLYLLTAWALKFWGIKL